MLSACCMAWHTVDTFENAYYVCRLYHIQIIYNHDHYRL